MNIVIDSNLLVAMATDTTRAPAVEAKLKEWQDSGDTLHAPSLLRYEVANSLVRLVVADALTAEKATQAWERIRRVSITLHELDDIPAAVAIALKLKRQNAYDASYVVLAQKLETDVWTLDGPLARNAEQTGLPVKLVAID